MGCKSWHVSVQSVLFLSIKVFDNESSLAGGMEARAHSCSQNAAIGSCLPRKGSYTASEHAG